jgi:hypothetical protein
MFLPKIDFSDRITRSVEVFLADSIMAERLEDFTVVGTSRAIAALLPEPQEAGTGKRTYQGILILQAPAKRGETIMKKCKLAFNIYQIQHSFLSVYMKINIQKRCYDHFYGQL